MDKQQAKETLIRLQKRLIINETNAQSFYTKFSDSSRKMKDLYKLGDNVLMQLFQKSAASFRLDESIISKLSKLYLENESQIKETGIDSLQIGWPYITGIIKDEHSDKLPNLFRAPLLLWKVTIIKNSNTSFELLLDTDEWKKPLPQFNIGLLSRISVINKKSIDTNSINIDTSDAGWIKKVIKEYQNAGLNFEDIDVIENIMKNFKNSPFSDASAKKTEILPNVSDIVATVSDKCVLGLFSFNNISLYKAYEKMISTDNGIEFYKNLSNRYSNEMAEQADFKEENIYQIDKLDYSQKQAVNRALKESLVIQGPPGTGKSQTITNIIANALIKNKRILFVTEKYVAAEVVENRLLNLNSFCLPIFDMTEPQKKADFYKKISEHFSRIYSCRGEKILSDGMNDYGKQIEEELSKINEYERFKTTNRYQNYLNFICKYGNKFDELQDTRKKYSSLLSLANSSDEFWAKINWIDDIVKIIKEIRKIQNKYDINENELYILSCLSIKYENTEKFHNHDIAYFIKRRKIKEVYNFIDKFFIIRKIIKTQICKKISETFKKLQKNEISILSSIPEKKIKESFALERNGVIKSYYAFCKDKYNEKNFDFEIFNILDNSISFEKENSHLLSFNKELATEKINELLLKKEKYDRKFIYEKILNEVQSKIKGDDYNENYLLQKECSDLYHQSKLIRHTKTVAQSLKMYKNAISAVFPVIISNPDVAASLYGGQKDLFDYVIFDEASQVTLERSVPILFLGKINIISGDQKQLQPSDFFQGKMKDEYEDTYVEGEDDQILDFSDIEDSSSLLAFTEKKFHKTMLTYHYRSQKRELIEFSNAVFYDRNLIVANTPKDNQLGIEVKTIVDGVWNERVNEKEAYEVIKLLKKICANDKHGSIGIITFNINQKNLIEELVMKTDDIGIKMETKRRNERDGSDESLFIKNIENVQGDERDIIIFSNTYAKTPNGRFLQSYGPINKKGGENRINVAVSRAREKIYIVKSFYSSEILRKGKDVPIGKKVFGDYIEYCELFAKHKSLEHSDIKTLLNSYSAIPPVQETDGENTFDSDFEQEVFQMLKVKLDAKKFDVVSQVEQSGYSIDLCIKDIRNNTFLLAIECDGFPYHSSISQKERDFYRQNYLESRGWKFFRIPSRKWYRGSKEEIINEICSKIIT